jgi:hypothetical protein
MKVGPFTKDPVEQTCRRQEAISALLTENGSSI